jgi:hypothetical protein
MPASERLIRFMVVAEYHRYDSRSESLVIHPDQSIKQMIENARNVSIARNNIGLRKKYPAWAIVQYSKGAWRCRRSSIDRPVFIIRSETAQRTTIHPVIINKTLSAAPVRITISPKRSLKTQNGIPIVKLKKNGRPNRLCIASLSLSHLPESLWGKSWDMVV